eukprot:CAMPEP_0177754234 /NCGR_PEP_ID=MMETSP0491_2-20121128/1900_1 /TAXON_ID=63592 /ORGANISM="Tetraselmis chuii, Strain PLY429" /LENGTH=243 /DNA_ID=CAMNT_0019269603 /DNA_START=153 /DNA_END=884 /DNA_ORIENTATION=+
MSTSLCAVQIRILHNRLAGAATTSYCWRSVGSATRPLRSRIPRLWSPVTAHTVVASASHDGNTPSRPPTEGALRLLATSERGTEAAAAMFAADLRAGDCYCLLGEVGAGKSAFSRAFIRSVMEDDTFPVPSPTYLLQNTYDEHTGAPIHHFDLYRLGGEMDMGRLSLSDSFLQAVCLVEWAERLEGSAPLGRMDVRITALSNDAASEYVEMVTASNKDREAVEEHSEDDSDDGEEEEMRFVDR